MYIHIPKNMKRLYKNIYISHEAQASNGASAVDKSGFGEFLTNSKKINTKRNKYFILWQIKFGISFLFGYRMAINLRVFPCAGSFK